MTLLEQASEQLYNESFCENSSCQTKLPNYMKFGTCMRHIIDFVLCKFDANRLCGLSIKRDFRHLPYGSIDFDDSSEI